ncbi:Kynurenine--oxoglutarate transaminase [Hondaea fermentalgiana]|uniref:Kynurenine--oxoglutarate transaminase n=1 Tax=Hondaea fermentalgiana TaxID=2315210 RepID=A0A2R5GH50_9STRA|nr:Kynurenine--oxoglutarate transaminase [Hondaea fermentalgiana]|eukprot:GBG30236.1 Kynurenine--oxoglutarate transaminase [Hondaea fermentalgiana]
MRGMATLARRLESRLNGGTGNIFAAATAMAAEYGSVNLGQGFPSFPTPDFVKKCAAVAITDNHNQYTRPAGNPVLVETLKSIYDPLFNRNLDAMSEIAVCSGAQEGIYNILVSFCDEGDTVLCVEPYFDAYKKAADLLGVQTQGVPLRQTPGATSAGDFKLDVDELDKAITSKTKVLVLNTPHNPTGKVFTRQELEEIAAIVRKHPQLVVLSDEVYEFMTFDGLPHERFALLDGMWDRTISLFSAGKTFSCTGWRVGYCIGPAHLVAPLHETQSIIAFCAPTPLQVGVARAFETAEEVGYYESLAATLQAKRDALCSALSAAGMKPIIPQGGYFVLADTSSLLDEVPVESADGVARDVRVNEWLTKKLGITGIPISGFYSPGNRELSDNVLRFAYCKSDPEISAAASKLLDASK